MNKTGQLEVFYPFLVVLGFLFAVVLVGMFEYHTHAISNTLTDFVVKCPNCSPIFIFFIRALPFIILVGGLIYVMWVWRQYYG